MKQFGLFNIVLSQKQFVILSNLVSEIVILDLIGEFFTLLEKFVLILEVIDF